MRRGRRLATFGLLLGALVGVAGCGDDGATPTRADATLLTYRPGLRLHPQSTIRRRGALRIEELTYSSVDGQRVPALFAVPTKSPPLGCMVFMGGFGTTRTDRPDARAGFAALRLATFSIDPRNLGARGSHRQAAAAIRTPEGLRAMVLNSVVDLRVGLDYLGRRPECHDNIGYMGNSFGGAVGTLLAAQDARISATVLTSIGASFKQGILVAPLAAERVAELPDYVPGAATNPAALAHAVSVLGPYDLAKWIGRIAPRPLMLINGRFDPLVVPGDALALAAAAGSPKTVVYFNGGHDPLAAGPDRNKVLKRTAQFLITNLSLPGPV